jgi:SpoVK/Ycf46/Vps4 family AAA+-type ATPase
VVVEVSRPTAREQMKLWKAALGLPGKLRAGRLAEQFNLDESAIRATAAAVRAGFPHPPGRPPARPNPRAVFRRAWDECRARTRPAVDGLAQRIDPAAGWDDLVLPDAVSKQLNELVAQVNDRWRVYDQWHLRDRMNRGLGVSALFNGDSGTGKTTAAEVVAGRLRLDLYRIDLSAVVNKYIGETEKNLRRVFDAFEDGGAVLFFDEADALFGKRTEVRDSHDRYANIEVSYLLQRLEAYRGLAILATNNRGALDPAFLRRLRFVVTFPTPDRDQRRAIWVKTLPPPRRPGAPPCRPGLPTDHLDYDWLAGFDKLTGGTIHAAAVHAAFLAAGRGHRAVTMDDVRDAVQAEYVKLNQPLRPAALALPKTTVRAAAPAQV